jgi:hypothetical protein
MKLFQDLVSEARRLDPAVRTGSMFGCPTLLRGQQMAACVYGDSIGLKVPEVIASISLRAGRATSFRPYGIPAIAEWIAIAGGARAIVRSLDLLAIAIAVAGASID